MSLQILKSLLDSLHCNKGGKTDSLPTPSQTLRYTLRHTPCLPRSLVGICLPAMHQSCKKVYFMTSLLLRHCLPTT